MIPQKPVEEATIIIPGERAAGIQETYFIVTGTLLDPAWYDTPEEIMRALENMRSILAGAFSRITDVGVYVKFDFEIDEMG